MSIKPQVDAITIGKRFAELVRERDLPVQGLWVRQTDGLPELLVVSESLEPDQLRPIYEQRLELRRTYPDALYDFRVLNPAWIPEFNEKEQIPANAKRIELRG